MYNKLFPIEYNNKRFMIFLDENNRRTFLEINEKDEFVFPNIEDFVALTKIFNRHEPFLLYAPKKYTFQEKVRIYTGALLSVVIMLNNVPEALAYELNAKEEGGNLIVNAEVENPKEEYSDTFFIDDLKLLDEFFGELDVTKELVEEAINNNVNLTPRYKKLALNLLNAITDEYPDINLRVFYENIKTMKIIEYSIDEFRKKFPTAPGGGANYDARTNTITTIDKVPVQILYHELFHAWKHLYRIIDGKLIHVGTTEYTSLDEVMTDEASKLVSVGVNSYKFAGVVTNYLRNAVGFNVNDFTNGSVDTLLLDLHQKYPDIDFPYIFQTLNSVNDYLIYQGKTVTIDNCTDLLEDLFQMCLEDLNSNIGYEPFKNFAKVFSVSKDPKLVFEYLEKYNERLKELGYKDIINPDEVSKRFSVYENANGLAVIDTKLTPIIYDVEANTIQKINPDGSIEEVNRVIFSTEFNFPSLISGNMFDNLDNFGSDDYWLKLSTDYFLISPHTFKSIPIYIDGELLSTEDINQLYLSIGETEEHEVAYSIRNRTSSQILYQSTDKIINVSNEISLSRYLNLFSEYIESADLSDVLNVDYLRIVQTYLKPFKNVKVNDKGVTIEPLYKVSIKHDNIIETYVLEDLQVSYHDGMITIGDTNISFKSDSSFEGQISLRSIFDFYKVINSGKGMYNFTDVEIFSLIENYVAENDLLNIGQDENIDLDAKKI